MVRFLALHSLSPTPAGELAGPHVAGAPRAATFSLPGGRLKKEMKVLHFNPRAFDVSCLNLKLCSLSLENLAI